MPDSTPTPRSKVQRVLDVVMPVVVFALMVAGLRWVFDYIKTYCNGGPQGFC